MNISDRILSRRTSLGLSKTALAKAIGVSDVTVGKWESGLNQPKGRYINDLAEVLRVSVDWLLTGAIKPPVSLEAMQVGERIQAARRKLGLEQSELAERVGATRELINQWERGEVPPSGEKRQQLLNVLKVDEYWLDYFSAIEKEWLETPNVVPAMIPQGRRIPVLSYVQAGQWREMCEQATAFDGNVEYVSASVDIGPCGFGLWVRGDSMGPQFKEGDLIIVDPDIVPKAGDFVVASNGKEEATFKKYRSRGEYDNGQPRFELVPLNEDHETLSTDQTPIIIIGVVVEHRSFFKRSG